MVSTKFVPRAAGRRPGDPWERLCVFAPNNENLAVFYITKLLQKSEMRKEIVIELSYKGFSRASDYS